MGFWNGPTAGVGGGAVGRGDGVGLELAAAFGGRGGVPVGLHQNFSLPLAGRALAVPTEENRKKRADEAAGDPAVFIAPSSPAVCAGNLRLLLRHKSPPKGHLPVTWQYLALCQERSKLAYIDKKIKRGYLLI